MSNDYGGTFITLTDENGEEVVLEYLDTVEYNGNIYMAFFPTLDEDVDPDEAEESEDYGLIVIAGGDRQRRGRTGHPGG